MNNHGLPLYAGTINSNQMNANYDTNYFENLLKINKGKKIKVLITIPDSNEFKDKEFNGVLEHSGSNYIILSDPNDGKWYILLNDYINFICSSEQINY